MLERFPQVRDSKILVAISGGVDSVVLAHLCRESRMSLSLAHCNFHLRGIESDEDEAFVKKLADKLQTEIFIEHFDTENYARENNLSIQMAARELRYKWFEEVRSAFHFDYILTAHHANDSLETFMINLVRGTGLEGLTGIPERNGFILRPLLPFSRNSIEEHAIHNQLEWREDSTNTSTKYLRNKIRKEIVPVMEQLNPHLLDSFLKTQDHLKQSSDLVEDYVSALFPKIAKEYKYGYSFNIKLLKTLPHLKAVLYELFKTFGFTEWDDIYQLLDTQSGKMVFSKTHRLIKDRENILLTTLPSEEDFEYEILEEEEVVMLPVGTFHLEPAEAVSEASSHTIYIDKNTIQFPLTVRKWGEGDYFYPFGMKGKKKISKFFKDIKLSVPEKENCLLLCSQGDIVWVIGHRADARFSVTENTAEIIKIKHTP